MFDTKIKKAMAMASKPAIKTDSASYKLLLESKAIQQIRGISDAKGYRCGNRKMKNEMEQVRPKARNVLEISKR